MKKILFTIFASVFYYASFSQETPQDTTWVYEGFFSQQFNQASFTNWAAGGENSLTSTSILSMEANYNVENITWENRLEMAYGILKSENLPVRKNEDRVDILSRVGRNINENLMVSAQANFQTQFDEGYDFPNDTVLVSRFMAPGYLLIALGLDYRPFEDFSIFLSPATGKFTFVIDDFLSQQGAYGVEPGENIRSEFGALLRFIFTRELLENVRFSSKLDLFNSYSRYTDVNWEGSINMKINRFLSASILLHLIYDHDIPIPIYESINGHEMQVGTGPRVQFKQLIGLGFSYSF